MSQEMYWVLALVRSIKGAENIGVGLNNGEAREALFSTFRGAVTTATYS